MYTCSHSSSQGAQLNTKEKQSSFISLNRYFNSFAVCLVPELPANPRPAVWKFVDPRNINPFQTKTEGEELPEKEKQREKTPHISQTFTLC